MAATARPTTSYGSYPLNRPVAEPGPEAEEAPLDDRVRLVHEGPPSRDPSVMESIWEASGLDEVQKRNFMLGMLAILILALNFVLGFLAARVTYTQRVAASLGSFLPEVSRAGGSEGDGNGGVHKSYGGVYRQLFF